MFSGKIEDVYHLGPISITGIWKNSYARLSEDMSETFMADLKNKKKTKQRNKTWK